MHNITGSSDGNASGKPTSEKLGSGQCLCGKLQVTCKDIDTQVHVCHCSTCQGWSGGPSLSVDCGTEVTFQGREYLTIYESSQWAERGFCAVCGTHLFYRLKHDQRYIMPVGLFGAEHPFIMHQQIFVDEKPAFYDFANTTEQLTGAEVFAQIEQENSS
jgi:hypothetical protein